MDFGFQILHSYIDPLSLRLSSLGLTTTEIGRLTVSQALQISRSSKNFSQAGNQKLAKGGDQ